MTTYAYCIGINNYTEPITSLRCAERDAMDLANLFHTKCGFESEYLQERKVEDIVGRIVQLGKRVQVGDAFIFYFAGHGKLCNDDHFFLLPGCHYPSLEAENNLNGGLLSRESLKLLTSEPQWRGVHRIFIFDACRDLLQGKNSDGNHEEEELDYLVRAAFGKKKKPSNSLVTVINSCDKGQLAIELPKRGNGLFTAALMEGLLDQSCAGRQIIIDQSFMASLWQRMDYLSKTHRTPPLPQRPVMTGDPIRLAILPTLSPQEKDTRNWRLACAINTMAAYKEYIDTALVDASYIDAALAQIAALSKEQNPKPEAHPFGAANEAKPEPKRIYPSAKIPPKAKRATTWANYNGTLTMAVDGLGKKKVTPLHNVSIGRSKTNSIIIKDNDIQTSGVHSLIYELNGKPMVRDVQSTNGTFLNGEKITHPESINDGDCIIVGTTKIKIIF